MSLRRGLIVGLWLVVLCNLWFAGVDWYLGRPRWYVLIDLLAALIVASLAWVWTRR